MDISFVTGEGRFNYRVCAVLLDGGRILAMRDERSPYYYLPGGRVRMGERAEDAVLREVREELGIEARIERPLWLSQSFFNEDVAHVDYHELCLYFLVDASATDLLTRGDRFRGPELRHVHDFEWLPFERLKNEYFYPIFLKTEIYRLPEGLTLRTDRE
jgi:ADP-ribose pyrophosphatase